MRAEISKYAVLIGGGGLGVLSWAIDHFKWVVPDWLVWLTLGGSVLLLIASGILWILNGKAGFAIGAANDGMQIIALREQAGVRGMPHFAELSENMKNFYPKHGWTVSSSACRQLRLPILRLYQLEAPHHQIYAAEGLAGTWLQCRSPYASLRQLAVALRELHAEVGAITTILKAEWFDKPPSEERDIALTKYREGIERTEVLLIAAFVLLRRLADYLIDASRPLLFTDWKSAPRSMKVAVARAREGTLVSLKPTCDVKRLEDALVNQTQWFDDLRQDDGLRDILVHKEHIFQVGGQGALSPGDRETEWRVTAHLTRVKADGPKVVDALPALRTCIGGLCDFMEQLYGAVGVIDNYQRGDLLFLTGDDGDVTGFWPSIS